MPTPMITYLARRVRLNEDVSFGWFYRGKQLGETINWPAGTELSVVGISKGLKLQSDEGHTCEGIKREQVTLLPRQG